MAMISVLMLFMSSDEGILIGLRPMGLWIWFLEVLV